MSSVSARKVWMVLGGLLLLAIGVVLLRRNAATPPRSAEQEGKPDTEATTSRAELAPSSQASAVEATGPGLGAGDARARAATTLGWGSGAGQIGKPSEEEGEGETPLRLAAGSAGDLLLLDAANGRLVRLDAAGKPLPGMQLPIKDPRDVGVAKDGTVVLLDADPQRGGAMLLGSDGKARGHLPLPPGAAGSARGVLVSGNDVYLESMSGELTRLGDVMGKVDPNLANAPGRPTRDGRGFLSALMSDPDSGRVHVFVVERPSLQQRFSRQLQSRLFVEGIFLIDSSVAGTIYIGVTGSMQGAGEGNVQAQLLCLEPERGEIIGAVDLPVNVGEEAILDAKALDSGGIAYSVFTKQGVRIERHDCQ